MLLSITLYKVVQTSSLLMKRKCVTIQMKAIEQYFHVVTVYYVLQGRSNFLSLWVKP